MATNKDFKVKNSITVTNGEGYKSTNVAGGTRTLLELDTNNILRIKGNDSEGSANVINVTAGANVGIGVTPSGTRFQIKGETAVIVHY